MPALVKEMEPASAKAQPGDAMTAQDKLRLI
jgi:hypothetical protein